MEARRSRQSATSGVASSRRGPAGYVYVMDNPSMPGIVKIGMTRRTPGVRLEELSSATGVPTPFRLCYYAKTRDCAWAEERVHHLLRKRRINRNREFFRISPEDAFKVVKRVADSPVRRGSGKLTLRTRAGAAAVAFLLLCFIQSAGILTLPYAMYMFLPRNGMVRWIESFLYPVGLNSEALLFSLAGALILMALIGKQTDRKRTQGTRRYRGNYRRRR